jgi:MYXO-CTERM domain-containing protein
VAAAPPAAAPTTKWEPPVAVAEPEPETPWLYIGLGGLLALLALLGLIASRRRKASATRRAEAEAVVPHSETEAPQEPDPLFAKRSPAAPAPAVSWVTPPTPAEPASDVGGVMRPRLELEFKAERAAATLTDASVQYELTIRNVGNAAARDVRIQPNMFNAGREQEKEISDFFALPVRTEEPAAFASFAPGAEANLKGSLIVPRDQLREITIEGRRLFIPILAFNVYYEWGDGQTGQTSMSYLVGREAPTPQDKMGAFRLDLGPRLYRSVGQRQAKLAKVV